MSENRAGMAAESERLSQAATRGRGRLGRRGGLLGALDRRIATMGAVEASVLLTGAAVFLVEMLHLIIDPLLFSGIRPAGLISSGVVTILVAMPVIAYSQVLIRKQIASRRALRQLTEQLALAADQAEAGNEAKSQFLATMSHELRTPLNAIIGFSELIRDQKLGALGTPRYGEYARDIHASGLHLLTIINDMLDLARIKAGAISTEDDRTCDLAAIFETVFKVVRPLAERQGVTLDRTVPDCPVSLVAAERVVRRVLLNILSNAVKFTPKGGRVGLRAQLGAGGELIIAVADTGVGMTAAEIGVALTPFGQVNAGLSRTHEGAGLGLPLAKALMELYDGSLTIDSAPRRGTTVILTFPAARVVPVAERPVLAVAS
jgi:signal transduction histidine kinase